MLDLVKDALAERGLLHQLLVDEPSVNAALDEFAACLQEENQYSIEMEWDIWNMSPHRYAIYSITIGGNIHYFSMLCGLQGYGYDVQTLEEVFPTPVTLDMLSDIKCFTRRGKPMLTYR